MKPIFYRPAQLRGFIFLGLLLLALGILGGMIWRNVHRFESVLSYVNYSHRIQSISVGLQKSLIEHLTETVPDTDPEILTETLDEMDALITDNRFLSAATRTNLEMVRAMLIDLSRLKEEEQHSRLLAALKLMSSTLDNETLQREELLEDVSRDTQTELYVALAIFLTILIIAVLFLRYRILHPLNDLRELLQRLTEENFTPITTDHLDPLLLPVFLSYNEMVRHLAELEDANRLHAQSLQQEVRLATQALLEQQYSLARAERLAAIGEVAAELAHEIRNPLAGIQMAFSNLRHEITGSDQLERLDLINAELKRMTRLLNDMLDQSRHSPEVSNSLDLSVLISDLVTLTRYQIAESIHLEIDAPSSLFVHLPESVTRQALLNLILNAADALEGNPGTICVKVYTNKQGLCIAVLDDGSGFSKDMLEHGIRPFHTSRKRGTGLGLAMVQRFVKDVGGTISLANQATHGARVSLLLPTDCIEK
jgi:C4-dicarboxylate-specific signal transduction histidine kinase